MTQILLAGDNFIRNELLADAISAKLSRPPQFSSLTLPWPQTPFGAVAEVDEASDCEEELIAAVEGAEIIVTQMAPMTARVFESASDLRLVVCTRGGPVNVNLDAAADHGVSVSCTPGRNAVATAEYAVLLMMAAMRRLPDAHMSLVAGEWRSWMYDYGEAGNEVAGSTVGVVGLGEVGSKVASAVAGMGATVLAYDPFVQEAGSAGVAMVSLTELLERSDVVTLHARLTPQTRGMIGSPELAVMRRGSVLVNTARGALLDYDAAAASLESGQLGALALDVFPEEPLADDSPLRKLSRVVVSPHLAGATRQTAARAAAIAAAEVERYVRQQPLQHVVNGVKAGSAR